MSFAYIRPADTAEAVALLREEGSWLLAGGTDLLPKIRRGLVRPRVVVDIKGLPPTPPEEGFVDARANLDTLIPRLRGPAGFLLAEAARVLGSAQVRNRASLGGNLANASPAADLAGPLLALGAEVVIVGPGGSIRRPVDGFWLSPGKTALEPGEIIWGAMLPSTSGVCMGAFEKYGLRQGVDLALVNVSVWIALGAGGTVARAGLALGGVGPVVLTVPDAAGLLRGSRLEPEVIREAAEIAVRTARPRDDVRASAERRRNLVRALVFRALNRVRRGLGRELGAFPVER